MMANDTFYFKDTTPSATERANRTGKYNLGIAKYIAREAEARKIDPYLALGVAAVESNFGKRHPSNPLQLRIDKAEEKIRQKYIPGREAEVQKANEALAQSKKTISESTLPKGVKDLANLNRQRVADDAITEAHSKANIKSALDHMIQRRKDPRAKTEILRLQAYNGLGTVKPGTEGYEQLYGTKEPINMIKNPVWAKKVLEYRDAIKGQMKGLGLGGKRNASEK